MEIEKEMYKIFLNVANSGHNMFDEFMILCKEWYDKPCHNFQDFRDRENKKLRGDIFESFCVLYLKHVKNYQNVYLLKDVPNELLTKLGLTSRDFGIDIIVENGNEYYAVQCKYRKIATSRRNVLSWAKLSTFYALAARTGPFDKLIVMTTAQSINRQGKKTNKDLSICIGTFKGISSDNWLKMCNLSGNSFITSNTKPLSIDELRNARLAKFS